MDKVESHLYQMLLSLGTYTPIITLSKEVENLLADFKTLQFSPSRKPVLTSTPRQFDISTLENWRLPDIPTDHVLTSLKSSTTNITSQNSAYHKMMLEVRECYTSNEVIVVPTGDKVDMKLGQTVSTGRPPSSLAGSEAEELGTEKYKASKKGTEKTGFHF